jgi:hypothetical protein
MVTEIPRGTVIGRRIGGQPNGKEPNQGSRQRTSVRKMRLENALFLHRTGQAGLRASRL